MRRAAGTPRENPGHGRPDPTAGPPMKRTLLVPALAALFAAPAFGADAPSQTAAPKPLTTADALAWKRIRSAVLSPNGEWLAYFLAPAEGDGELVLRRTQGS